MTTVHDIFLRAYAVSPKEKSQPKNTASTKRKISPSLKEPTKWPQYALVFDTESRVTPDQSLTFGVYRLCELVDRNYKVVQEGLFYADELSKNERKVLELYQQTAISDVCSFPPEFPLYSRTEFMQRIFWPNIKRGALVCGLNLPFDLSRLALDWTAGEKKRMVSHYVPVRRWYGQQEFSPRSDSTH